VYLNMTATRHSAAIGWLKCAVLSAFVVLATTDAAAQSPAQPTTERVELGFLVGSSAPSVVVEDPGGLRTPPTVRNPGENYHTITQSIIARIYWAPHMSIIAGVGWSTEKSRVGGGVRF
jgi:hypothetical protein